ncbi:MAG: hypothetical protein ACKVOM_05195 [Ferruginibacter sp.]
MRKLYFLLIFCAGTLTANAQQTFTSGLTTTGSGLSANTRLGGASPLLLNTTIDLGTFTFGLKTTAQPNLFNVLNNGNIGIGVPVPLSLLHFKAGTATVAPLRFTPGVDLTTAAAGAVEYDGTNLTFTPNTTLGRKIVAFADLSNITGTVLNTSGGTGFSTYATGDILYASAANVLSKRTIGATNQVLTVVGGVPTWATPTGWLLTGNAGTVPGTNFIGTTDDKDLLFKRYGTKAGLLSLYNTSFGLNSLNSITTGYFNTASGTNSLFNNTTGSHNVSIGNNSLYTATEAVWNTAVGVGSMELTTIGEGNVALGGSTLRSNTIGSYNVALGYNSLYNSTTPSYNVAIGMSSLEHTMSGEANTAVGGYSLRGNDIGSYNAAFGYQALFHSQGGNNRGWSNTGLGAFSLLGLINGNANTAIGRSSGSNLTSGDNNIFIGNSVQPNISNTASNQLNIGNWIYGNNGNIGIGVVSPAEKLDVMGSVYANEKIFIGTRGDGTANNPALTATQLGGNHKLYVNGSAIFTKAVVKLTSTWPDYVFEPTNNLPTLNEVEAYITKHKHLQGVPSAAEVKEKGIDLGDNQTILLKKVEELTLYIIELNKKVELLAKENEELKKKVNGYN